MPNNGYERDLQGQPHGGSTPELGSVASEEEPPGGRSSSACALRRPAALGSVRREAMSAGASSSGGSRMVDESVPRYMRTFDDPASRKYTGQYRRYCGKV